MGKVDEGQQRWKEEERVVGRRKRDVVEREKAVDGQARGHQDVWADWKGGIGAQIGGFN